MRRRDPSPRTCSEGYVAVQSHKLMASDGDDLEYHTLAGGEPATEPPPPPSAAPWKLLLLLPALAALLFFGRLPSGASAVGGVRGAVNGAVEAAGDAPRWYGVSLGGWLLMEINPAVRKPGSPLDLRPHWMFDQIAAPSELDFVLQLREEHGDEFAIATMKNHWSQYISDEMLDAAQALGVDTARLPVGYWIMDAPVGGGGSPLEYGISPEGFVTGGLNHLKEMLVKLKKRGMRALVDIHAMPCNSACVSDGLSCAGPVAFSREGTPMGVGTIGDLTRCDGGKYVTTRKPREGEETWGDVGVNTVAALAKWISELPEEAACVSAFQLANEPALGPPGIYEESVNAWYLRAVPAARKYLPTLPLVLSFIPPTKAVTDFIREELSGQGEIIADHHYYLNWVIFGDPAPPPVPWSELHSLACNAVEKGGMIVYTSAEQKFIVGEWSLAVNLDMKEDLSDPQVRADLTQLYREQLAVFGTTDHMSGAFFWTLRMGSGWDPRPSAGFPHGQQLAGTSAWKSFPEYPFKVWSLLEMAEHGIATPLNLSYASACEK